MLIPFLCLPAHSDVWTRLSSIDLRSKMFSHKKEVFYLQFSCTQYCFLKIPPERCAIFKFKYRVTSFRNISVVQDQKDLCINEYIQNALYLKGTRTTMCLSNFKLVDFNHTMFQSIVSYGQMLSILKAHLRIFKQLKKRNCHFQSISMEIRNFSLTRFSFLNN